MKKIIAVIMIAAMMLSLCACGKGATSTITSEVVECVVTDAYSSRWGTYIVAECDGVSARFDGLDLYNQYNANIGSVIKAVLITRTYENGDIVKTLVFNQNVFEGGDIK